MGNQDMGVVCIGGANVDRKARCLQPAVWRTSNPVTISESCGGVARNVAENLGRLDCRPSLITCVGDDREGEWLLAETSAHGVNVSATRRVARARTGSYTAVLDPSGEMVIAFNEMSVTDQLTPEVLDACWNQIAAARIVFTDTNPPPATLAYVIDRCRSEGLRLVVDPVSAIKAQRLPARLDGVSAILPDRLEAAVLAGLAIVGDDDGEPGEAWATLAARIRQRGAHAVVISLGAGGLFYTSPETAFHLPPLVAPAEVVDVTGAGDALTAGFLVGLLRDEPPERCCRLGLAAAARTVRSAQSVAPDLALGQL